MADGFIRLDAALPGLAGCTLFSLSQENEERIKRKESPILFFRFNVLDDAEYSLKPFSVVAEFMEPKTLLITAKLLGDDAGRTLFEFSINDFFLWQEHCQYARELDGPERIEREHDVMHECYMAYVNEYLPVTHTWNAEIMVGIPKPVSDGYETGIFLDDYGEVVTASRFYDEIPGEYCGHIGFLLPKDVEKHLFLPMDYFKSLRGEVRPVADEKPVDAPTVASGAPTGDGTAAASKPVADATFGGSLDDIQAKELRLAIAAYFHAEKRVADGGGYPFKRYIEEYLKGAGLSSDAAIKRIATVANKDKKTGRK